MEPTSNKDRGSPVYDINKALELVIKIREKKVDHDGDCIRFYRFARRECGIRSVRQPRKEHAVAYVRDMGQRELADDYIGRVKASLRKLSGAIFGSAAKVAILPFVPPFVPLTTGLTTGLSPDHNPAIETYRRAC